MSGDRCVITQYWLMCNLPYLLNDVIQCMKIYFTYVARCKNQTKLASLFLITLNHASKSIEWNDILRSEISNVMYGSVVVRENKVFSIEGYTGRIVHELSSLLLRRDYPTYYMILHILVFIFTVSTSTQKEDKVFIRACNTLITVATRLDYGDIIWLYVFHLNNPTQKTMCIQTNTRGNKISSVLMSYISSLRKRVIEIKTLQECYKSNLIDLYFTLIHLLLKETRYDDALKVHSFCHDSLGLCDSLAFLHQLQLRLPHQYNTFIEKLTCLKVDRDPIGLDSGQTVYFL